MDLDTEKQPKQNSTHLPICANYKYTCHLHATFYIIKLLDLILLRTSFIENLDYIKKNSNENPHHQISKNTMKTYISLNKLMILKIVVKKCFNNRKRK